MRVGIDARILGNPRSGIAVYTLNLVEQFLKDKSVEIVLFGDRPIFEEYRYITDKTKTVIFGQEHRKRWSQFYLPAQLKKYGIDVYHATWNNAVPVFTRVPCVLTVHDIIPLIVPGYFKNAQKRYKYIFSMKSALRKAKAVIVDAQVTKIDLIKHFKVSPDKIDVISLGARQVDKNTVSGMSGINSDYIINIGSFDKRRNADTLIRAFAGFIKSSGVNCKLVLVGGYNNFPDEMKRFDSIISGLNIKDKVIFTNYVTNDEMQVLLAKAKMMVHLSLYEGFCFLVLEAMQAGIPLIASNTGSVPEVAGEAAVLVDPLDEAGVTAAIKNLWNDKNAAARLVEAGKQRVKSFSWEKTAKETRKIYEKIS